MVKRRKQLVPQPRSVFLRVKCPDCGNEQVLFSHASSVVKCLVCGRILAKPSGGKATIEGEVIKELG